MKKVVYSFIILSLLLSFAGCSGSFTALQNGNSTQTADSPEEIFKSFLNGEVVAETKTKETADINSIKESASGGYEIKYTLFDRNSDSIPELAVNNGANIFTFWLNDGNIEEWAVENSYTKILNNGNSLQVRKGGAPEHTDYNYYIYNFSGDETCMVVLSEYLKDGIDVLEDTYVLNISFQHETESELMEPIKVTEEQFNSMLAPLLKIGSEEVVWNVLK